MKTSKVHPHIIMMMGVVEILSSDKLNAFL